MRNNLGLIRNCKLTVLGSNKAELTITTDAAPCPIVYTGDRAFIVENFNKWLKRVMQ